MVVVNQQHVEDDKHHGSNESAGSVDAIATVNDSKEADIELQMIRLYKAMFENDNSHGSSSSTARLHRGSATLEAENELMIRVYKNTICPMIHADINRKHQNFLFMVKENFGVDLSTRMTWNLHDMESNIGSGSLQLKFLNGICERVSTGMIIEGNEQKPFLVALVDSISGQIVTAGAAAAMEVEIVVLEGDSNDDEADKWTCDEFNNKIISNWNGNKVLQGNTFVKLNEGVVFVDKISFTHNSGWKTKRKCRIGARSSVNAGFLAHVKEAKTESFFIRDKRNDLYCKHKIPSLSDAVYRLKLIPFGGDCFNALTKAHIKTVMDFLTIHAINPQWLGEILNVCPKKWNTIMNHAKMCKDDHGIYLYHYPRDGQKSNGMAFNIYGKLVGIIAESQFVPCDKLPNDQRAEAEKLIVSSSKHWDKVVPFSDDNALISHLQQHTTVRPSPHNNLNVVIPQTTDRQNYTNLTSPKSQSPKRPASELISNSPKQARYDRPSVVNNLDLPLDDEHDYLKYLNMNLRDGRWKIVWCAVGWISIILQVRRRR